MYKLDLNSKRVILLATLIFFSTFTAFAMECREEPGNNTEKIVQLEGGRKAVIGGSDPNSIAIHVDKLKPFMEKIAAKCGSDLRINSAFRSCKHPAERKKGKGKSGFHPRGVAMDWSCGGKSGCELAKISKEVGCDGVGSYATFSQCDARGSPAAWGKCSGGRQRGNPAYQNRSRPGRG